MTPEELKGKIRFRRRKTSTGDTQITAILFLGQRFTVSEFSTVTEKELDAIKSNMREMVARKVYEDRRREFRELLTDFMRRSIPCDYNDKAPWQESMRKLTEWSGRL